MTTDRTALPPEDNDILAALPAAERGLLLARSEYVTLDYRQLLIDSERPIDNVYFIVDGIASILSAMADSTGVETATVGRDGMSGLEIFHGVDRATEQTMMQVPGAAYRIPSAAFTEVLRDAPTLRGILHRFSVLMFTFAAQNSGCNRKHPVEMRCARWLLTVANNLRRPELDLTHEFMSQMLGVRRATVTDTLSAFEKRGLITTRRRHITILDMEALRAGCCECHEIIMAARARLMGNPRRAESPLKGVRLSEEGTSTIGEPHG